VLDGVPKDFMWLMKTKLSTSVEEADAEEYQLHYQYKCSEKSSPNFRNKMVKIICKIIIIIFKHFTTLSQAANQNDSVKPSLDYKQILHFIIQITKMNYELPWIITIKQQIKSISTSKFGIHFHYMRNIRAV